jgi:iron complex transport system substrate-binding protein
MLITPEMHVKSPVSPSVAPKTGPKHLVVMRIASLLASATEIVCALGLGDELVAISHECDYPPEALSKPRVSGPVFDPAGLSSGEIDAAVRAALARHGRVYEVDMARLHSLRPDVMLTQAVCDVCAVPTVLARDAAQGLGAECDVVSLDAHTLSDVIECISIVGRVARVQERAAQLVTSLMARLERVRHAVGGQPRPAVLALEWLDPPFVPGHWVPEMIEVAGGRSLAGIIGRPSQEVSWDHLAALDPDVLIVMPCGYGLDQARRDAERHVEQVRCIAPRAVESDHTFVVDGSAYFNRSGPRVVDGVELLAALLHPGRMPDVALEGRAGRLPSSVARAPHARS